MGKGKYHASVYGPPARNQQEEGSIMQDRSVSQSIMVTTKGE